MNLGNYSHYVLDLEGAEGMAQRTRPANDSPDWRRVGGYETRADREPEVCTIEATKIKFDG